MKKRLDKLRRNHRMTKVLIKWNEKNKHAQKKWRKIVKVNLNKLWHRSNNNYDDTTIKHIFRIVDEMKKQQQRYAPSFFHVHMFEKKKCLCGIEVTHSWRKRDMSKQQKKKPRKTEQIKHKFDVMNWLRNQSIFSAVRLDG